MKEKLVLDVSQTKKFYDEKLYEEVKKEVVEAHKLLRIRKGAGNDFLGWLDLPFDYDKEEFARIKKSAQKIQDQSQVLLAIGIGGSYLGAKSAVEMFKKYFNQKGVELIFVGNQISSTYLVELLDYVKDKDYSINVISKSGTTLEPAIAFRVLKDAIEQKYGKEEARKRIYATTDAKRGALKTLANNEGYESFVVPDDIGGRFSVLTAVGLLPIAVSGVDIKEIFKGAQFEREQAISGKENSIEATYATIRNLLYRKGFNIELLINYEPRLIYFAEWFKQLFGESEGKDHKGIYPSSVSFSTDLHSLGQMIQDGERRFFETILDIEKPIINLDIPLNEENLDGLNFLKGKTVDDANKMAMEGTCIAHTDGGVPNMKVKMDEISAFNYGRLVYFFEFACGLSAYTLGVNPFNQPGVEAYKKNMFALLDKPGYEERKKEILAKK